MLDRIDRIHMKLIYSIIISYTLFR